MSPLASHQATQVAPDVAHDLEILNFALEMEFLANAFYNEAEAFDLGTSPQGAPINQIFKLIQLHHAAHVGTIIEDISQRGGTPVWRGTYSFPVSDIPGFVQHAVEISELLVSTYYGGMKEITHPRILVGASQFAAVNARIQTFIRSIAQTPIPETPRQTYLSMADVRARASVYLA